MINLESLNINKDTKEVRADFGGFLEDGFYINCEVEWNQELEPEEEEIGRNESLIISDLTFWFFNIYNSAKRNDSLFKINDSRS